MVVPVVAAKLIYPTRELGERKNTQRRTDYKTPQEHPVCVITLF